MDIEKYRTFVTAAGCASFADAAEKLFLSTPTVTKHICALEREMGVFLFERQPHGVRLTEAGQARIELARQIVDSYDALAMMNANRSLQLYSIPCLEKTGVPRYLIGFAAVRPEISVSVTERHGTIVLDDLLNNRCELAFLGKPYANHSDLESVELFNEKLCVALPETHRLAGEARISLRQLEDDGFIFMHKDSGLYRFYEECCLSCGFKPKVKVVCSREDSILSYVGSGMGVAFFSFGMMKNHNVEGVTFVELEEEFYTGCLLAKKKGRRLTGPANAFWKYIVSAKL